MPTSDSIPCRFIGLDIHKEYFVAIGVDSNQNQIFGPHRASMKRLDSWIAKHLTHQDAVVLEMTVNTYKVHDKLKPHVQTVTVVHPPHVALIVRAQVKTDKKAALILAQLHAAGLLPGVWIPPVEIRDLRALLAQRLKMQRIRAQAKNRLHAFLGRNNIFPNLDGMDIFDSEMREWWQELPATEMERFRIQADLDTLEFADQQVQRLQDYLNQLAPKNDVVTLLVQIPGIGVLTALTIMAAIGDISRFPSSKQLVGYAGLGASVHDSGQSYTTGRITKAGRKDLRKAMVEAANHAIRSHNHWQAEFKRLEPRKGRSKAVVTIARKLLVVVWHLLTEETSDRFGKDEQIARQFFCFAYRVGIDNLPDGLSAKQFTRNQLDRLGVGQEMTHLPWGSKRFLMPPSTLMK
ncbi:MAG: IS110 family transposase [Anaerolineaceae bacterium]|nr:IS110 family transposase [Anaerolineaceae bacterium]